MTTPTPPSQTSPFLTKLPPELRNNIYELVLTSHDPIAIDQDNLKTHTALTQTCTEIRSESLPLFYATNTFTLTLAIGEANKGLTWLHAIGKPNASLIKQLKLVSISSHASMALVQQMREMAKINDVTVRADITEVLIDMVFRGLEPLGPCLDTLTKIGVPLTRMYAEKVVLETDFADLKDEVVPRVAQYSFRVWLRMMIRGGMVAEMRSQWKIGVRSLWPLERRESFRVAPGDSRRMLRKEDTIGSTAEFS